MRAAVTRSSCWLCILREHFERDNRYGLLATWKRVYTFALPEQSCMAGQTVAQCVAGGAVVTKTLFEDLVDEYFTVEKVESLVVMRNGDVWMALENDGGEIEPRMVREGVVARDGIEPPTP